MKKGQDIYCNMCGKKIKQNQELPMEDFVSVTKSWGYFSGKDGEIHEFELCETCYDEMISRFQIPVAPKEQKEML